MCLSIPSKVVKINEDKLTAVVDTMGVKRDIGINLVADEVKVGDYVLVHVGYAMNVIDEKSALDSLELYQEIIDAMDKEEQERLIEESDSCMGKEET